MGTITPVAVVAASSRALNRWVGDRARHYPSVVAVDVPPAADMSIDLVCNAVLAGLGKDSELTHGKTAPVPLTEAWLSLGEHTDVVFVEAQLIQVGVIDAAIDLFARYGVRTWLIVSPPPADPEAVEKHLGRVTDRGGETVDEAALRAQFPNVHRPAPTAVTSTRPRLPRTSGYTFRSACRDLLDADHFAEVDAKFVAAVLELRDEIGSISGAAKGRTLMRKLQQRLVETCDTDELILWTAAAQVAVLPYQFMVTVHLPTLLGAAEGLPRRGKAEAEGWWEALNAYRDPHIGAVAALYHAEIDPEKIRLIERTHVTPRDPAGLVTVLVDGSEHEIRGPSARFVEAQRVYRELATVGQSEFLFATHRAGHVRLKHVNNQLLVPAAELDVQLAVGPVRVRHPDADRWLQRYGIRVEKLTYSPTDQAVAS
jgi:hypothetical protein